MFCGTGSFKHVDDDQPHGGAGASPKAKKRASKVNLYAERGLDKFSTVLFELESRREKILRRVGSENLVMVRFVQSDRAADDGWASVVVKLPEPKQETKKTAQSLPPPPPKPASPKNSSKRGAPAPSLAKRERLSWSERMGRTGCYWPAAMVLVLLGLLMFGRVFAICCISIWWYLVPTFSSCKNGGEQEQGLMRRRSMKKKKKKGIGVHEVISSPRSHEKEG